jgi:hypothetical protein
MVFFTEWNNYISVTVSVVSGTASGYCGILQDILRLRENGSRSSEHRRPPPHRLNRVAVKAPI